MNILLLIGIAMASGLLVSRAARAVKLPNVTAFLVAGLIIGPCVAGIISKEQAESMGVISEAALGFIAYAIGGEFKLSYLKKIGKAPLTITAFQGLMTAFCVDVGLIAFGVDVPLAPDRFVAKPPRRVRDDAEEQVAPYDLLAVLLAPHVHHDRIDIIRACAVRVAQTLAYRVKLAHLHAVVEAVRTKAEAHRLRCRHYVETGIEFHFHVLTYAFTVA